MNNRLSVITLLSLCFFTSAHGMFSWFGGGGEKEKDPSSLDKEEKISVALCDDPYKLSAPEEFKTFMAEDAHVGLCYDLMVGLAELRPKKMETTFADIIKGFGGGGWFGGTMKWTAEKFKVPKLMTDGLIESREDVRLILERAANTEEKENEKEEVSIFNKLSSIKNMNKVLPEQAVSLCTVRALLFVAKEQKKVVDAIKEQMLGKNLQNVGLGKVLDWVVPRVFKYSVENQEFLRVRFALMARSIFAKQPEKENEKE